MFFSSVDQSECDETAGMQSHEARTFSSLDASMQD
jgi:hypothetical protein